MPFTDPMADGPAIQAAGLRALAAGTTLAKTLALTADFRKSDSTTPIVLMGYYNPVYAHGREPFLPRREGGGVEGLIIVDLPPSRIRREPARRLWRGARSSSASRHRRPTMRGCQRCCPVRRALSITSRSPALPAAVAPDLGQVAGGGRLKRAYELAGRGRLRPAHAGGAAAIAITPMGWWPVRGGRALRWSIGMARRQRKRRAVTCLVADIAKGVERRTGPGCRPLKQNELQTGQPKTEAA